MGIQHYENGKRTDILHTFNDEIIDDDWSIREQINMGELATRLGAKQGFDNRGRQIWVDGVEAANIRWNTVNSGGGAVSRSLSTAWTGEASLQLSTGAAGIDSAGVTKLFYSPLTNRYGIEMAWSSDNLNLVRIHFYIVVYVGASMWRGYIGYDTSLGAYFYGNSAGNNISLGQIPVLVSDKNFWHKIKLVIDCNSFEYVRALFDGVEHDLTGQGLRNFAVAGGPRIEVWAQVDGWPGGAYNVYVDDFILTHLEP